MRERMIESAALFLDATSRSVRELHMAAAAVDPGLKEQHLLEASAAYDAGYEGNSMSSPPPECLHGAETSRFPPGMPEGRAVELSSLRYDVGALDSRCDRSP